VIIPLRGDEVRRPGRKARPPTVFNPTGPGPTTDLDAVPGIASGWKSGLPDPLRPAS